MSRGKKILSLVNNYESRLMDEVMKNPLFAPNVKLSLNIVEVAECAELLVENEELKLRIQKTLDELGQLLYLSKDASSTVWVQACDIVRSNGFEWRILRRVDNAV